MEKSNHQVKKPFTLLELYIVFALMSITVAVLLFPSQAIFKKKKYEKSLVQLTHQLHLAKQLAYGLNTNIKVHLTKEENIFAVSLEFDEDMKSSYPQYQKPQYLYGIDSISEKGLFKDSIVVEYEAKWGPKHPTHIEIFSKIQPEKNLIYEID